MEANLIDLELKNKKKQIPSISVFPFCFLPISYTSHYRLKYIRFPVPPLYQLIDAEIIQTKITKKNKNYIP